MWTKNKGRVPCPIKTSRGKTVTNLPHVSIPNASQRKDIFLNVLIAKEFIDPRRAHDQRLLASSIFRSLIIM